MPTAAITSIIIFLILEVIFLVSSDPLTGQPYLQPTADDATVTAKQSLLKKSGGRVVIVGDSSAMYGLQPSIISGLTETPTVNLGSLASFTSAGYTELAIAAMAKEIKPLAIVFSVLPQTLEIDAARADQYNLLGRYLTAYENNAKVYSPSFEEVRALWLKKHQFNIFPGAFGGSYENFLNTLTESDGWLKEHHTFYASTHSQKFGDIKVSTLTWDSFRALKAASEFYSVPVLFIFNPKPRSEVVVEAYERSTSEILRVAKEDFGFSTTQFIAPTWDERLFGTVTHLNELGSEIYSKETGLALQDLLVQYAADER